METKNILAYLEEMKGRILKIYKDGPESKTGKLINVNKDIITIQTENNQIVYYQLKHIKSIIENSKASILWEDDDEEANEIRANNFLELLKQLKLQKIQINGGGPANRTGILIDLNPDYLVLQTKKDGVVYYQLEHIKSISPETDEDDYDDDDEDSYEEDPEYIEGSNLFKLLQKMKHHWIIINGKGPENIEGVLVDFTNDHILVVHHDNVFRISTYHINSIRLGFKNQDHSQQNEDDDDETEGTNKKENRNNKNKDSKRNEKRSEQKKR